MRSLVFGDFVLQTLFRRRRALERLRLGIQIVGSRFDRETHRLREFAARNRVVHDWLDIDDPRAEALLGAHADVTSGPIILLGGGTLLRNPSSAELAERAKLQAQKFHVRVMVPRRAVGLTERDGFHVIALDDGAELLARSVILALSVQYRRLPIPRIADYEGLGVAHAANSARQQLRSGDAAVVVGGANSAGQTALSLAEEGRRVHLVVRADSLARSMARYLRERIEGVGP